MNLVNSDQVADPRASDKERPVEGTVGIILKRCLAQSLEFFALQLLWNKLV